MITGMWWHGALCWQLEGASWCHTGFRGSVFLVVASSGCCPQELQATWGDMVMMEACCLQGLCLHETCGLHLAWVRSSHREVAICSLDTPKTLLEFSLQTTHGAECSVLLGSGWKWSECALAIFS